MIEINTSKYLISRVWQQTVLQMWPLKPFLNVMRWKYKNYACVRKTKVTVKKSRSRSKLCKIFVMHLSDAARFTVT